jgi:hypothetical protein
VYARGDGAGACPDEQALRKEVAARLGYDPFFAVADKTIVVLVSRESDRFEAQIRLVDGSSNLRGTRRLLAPSADCEGLLARTALAISVAIDPDRATDGASAAPSANEGQSEPESPSEATAPSNPEKRAPVGERDQGVVPSAPAVVEAPPLPVTFDASVLGSSGVLPALAYGASLGAAFGGERGSIGAEIFGFAPQSKSVENGSVRAWTVGAIVVPCYGPKAIFGCALASLGVMQSGSDGIAAPRSQSTWIPWLGIRAGTSGALTGGWSWRVTADLAASLNPVHLQIDERDVWNMPRVAFVLGVGVTDSAR